VKEWLRQLWYGEINPCALIYTVEFKGCHETELTQYWEWKRTFRFENSSPVTTMFAILLYLTLWVPYAIFFVSRAIFYTMWLRRDHPFVVTLKHNLEVLDAKYGSRDGSYY